MAALARVHYPRRRRVFVAHWLLDIDASLMGGTVLARKATAMGRQIFVVRWACGTIRHMSV